MMTQELEDLDRAVDQLIPLPQDAVAVKQPGIVLVQQVEVMFTRAQASGHGGEYQAATCWSWECCREKGCGVPIYLCRFVIERLSLLNIAQNM